MDTILIVVLKFEILKYILQSKIVYFIILVLGYTMQELN